MHCILFGCTVLLMFTAESQQSEEERAEACPSVIESHKQQSGVVHLTKVKCHGPSSSATTGEALESVQDQEVMGLGT